MGERHGKLCPLPMESPKFHNTATPNAVPSPQPPATDSESPATNSEPTTSLPPVTKRSYTVTPKVLAAARANLAKANAVSKSVRYRPTAKRLVACRANLLKAQAAQRADT